MFLCFLGLLIKAKIQIYVPSLLLQKIFYLSGLLHNFSFVLNARGLLLRKQ